MKRTILFYILFLTIIPSYATQPLPDNLEQHQVADLVIFSYDRPMQLYALLESIGVYMQGLGQVHVIYRSSNARFDAAYDRVRECFNSYTYHQQGANPRHDFKPLTVHATFESACPYILYAVDDIIVKDHVDISYCIECLERHQAYGFYLRLGTHLNYCYSCNHAQEVPVLQEVEQDIFAWRFNQGHFDWGYPNTADMTLYRKKDIERDVKSMLYTNPNSFEGTWAGRSSSVGNQRGLCFKNTKIINIPINRVQDTFLNRNMNFLTSMQMLELFEAGNKIDIKPLFDVRNNAAHVEYEPCLIPRS